MVSSFDYYLMAKRIYEKCREYGHPESVCNEISREFIRSDTDIPFSDVMEELIEEVRMGRIDKKYIDILTDIAAYNGIEIPHKVTYILYAFRKRKGKDGMKRVLPYIFEPLEKVYKHLKSGDYKNLDTALNNIKRQISELRNLIYPPGKSIYDIREWSNQADTVVETIMQKITESEKLNKPTSLEELLQAARQAIEREKSKHYR